MGFAWTEDISVGASADPVDILEIRTNVDTVDNEKCLDDETSYDVDDKDGDNPTYDPGYCNDDNGTYRNDDHGDYDNADDYTYKNDDHGDYDNGDKWAVRDPRWP